MILSYKKACKTWIYSDEEGPEVPVAQWIDCVINPENGQFEAFWVRSLEGVKLLLPEDITEWTNDRIQTNSSQNFATPEELTRLKSTLEHEIGLLKKSVIVETSKKVLGKVSDFSFETIAPRLLSVEISTGLFGLGTSRIIPESQITKITPQGIFIKDENAKIKPQKKNNFPQNNGNSEAG